MPPTFYPREIPGTLCTGGWVGPRDVLDECGKSRSSLGFETRTVQPVASRYTEYVILVHSFIFRTCKLWEFKDGLGDKILEISVL
jgi:hypothetical protein